MRCIARQRAFLYSLTESDLHQRTWRVSKNEAHLDSRNLV